MGGFEENQHCLSRQLPQGRQSRVHLQGVCVCGKGEGDALPASTGKTESAEFRGQCSISSGSSHVPPCQFSGSSFFPISVSLPFNGSDWGLRLCVILLSQDKTLGLFFSNFSSAASGHKDFSGQT